MRFIRNSFLLRLAAVFILLEMFSSIVCPAVSWALTAGPTAPEASSFEPVDTTDMVNTATGDFVYNLPLLEVPGPAGGYPLSLSYHGGVMLNEEASWVGLGFTLNPGAINRSVSGYVDDFFGVTESSRSFWEGGATDTYSLGVSTGYGLGPGLDAGLEYSDDTYKGRGLGYSIGFHTGVSAGPAHGGMNVTYGVSPYGQSYNSTSFSVGIGVSQQNGVSLGANAGIAFDQDSKITTSSGLHLSSSQGITISSDGRGGFSGGGGGATGSAQVFNAKSGSISTSGYNYNLNVPTPWGFSVRLGKSYQRYWSDETANVGVYGSLYFPFGSTPPRSLLDNEAYDVYDLMNPSQPLSENGRPDEGVMGSFADYDHYQVLGQGISGTIRPYHFKTYLIRQNKKNGELYRLLSYPLNGNKKANFRFEGDFSNRYIHDITNDQFTNTNNSNKPMAFSFDSNATTGESGTDGYVPDKNRLAGSRSVEWFTNTQIFYKDGNEQVPDAAIGLGFIDCKASGFNRTPDERIGGFKVQNESGVTYHYALPVYSYNEYSYSGKKDQEGKHNYNLYHRNGKYAYTWLLTAVTGPDFVDRNNNGYADQGDWGYWVTFEYGKWSSRYGWRNPAEGTQKDIDQEFNNFSKGFKEVYYLNSVTTATHTALFVKEVRKDSKGVVSKIDGAIKDGSDHHVEDLDLGGFTPVTKEVSGTSYTEYPVSSLRLAAIYLLKNEDIPVTQTPINELANTYFHQNDQNVLGKYTLGKNVLDVFDAASSQLLPVLTGKALRAVKFNTDYGLCDKTPNSFTSDVDVLNTPQSASATKSGKLRLKSVSFLGRKGSSLVPDISFEYDAPYSFSGSFIVTPSGTNRKYSLTPDVFDGHEFKRGEIVKSAPNLWGYIEDVDIVAHKLTIAPIEGSWENLNNMPGMVLTITKNPPYHEDMRDAWGNYKVDHFPGESDPYEVLGVRESENVSRMVTSTSAQSVDVWSLQKIKSSLGAIIQVEYESDRYRNAIKSLSNIPIKNVELVDGKTKITLYEDVDEYGLSGGQSINMRMVNAFRFQVDALRNALRFHCSNAPDFDFIYHWVVDDIYEGNGSGTVNTIPIESAQDQSIVIDYDYTDRFPTKLSQGFLKDPPYTSADVSTNDPHRQDYITIEEMEEEVKRFFLGGEILTKKISKSYGGGLRVKSISVSSFGTTRSTLYSYENGVTSYEPLGFEVPVRRIAEPVNQCLRDLQNSIISVYRDKYIADVYSRFGDLFMNSREMPGPEVLYQRVTVKERIQYPGEVVDFPGKTEYVFEVFSPETIDLGQGYNNSVLRTAMAHPATPVPSDPLAGWNSFNQLFGQDLVRIEPKNGITTKNFGAIMGSLKRVTLYDELNNKITETENQYIHDDFTEQNMLDGLQRFKQQGTITETFADAKMVLNPTSNPNDPNYTLYGVLSHRIFYPSIQTGQTVKNFKTGITTTTNNDAFDFYSGQTTKTITNDGYGNSYLNESVPAYRFYDAMKPTVLGGKNMLTQKAASYVYKLNPTLTSKTGLLSASMQSWSDGINALAPNSSQASLQSGKWRIAGSYTYVGDDQSTLQADGTYPMSGFSPWVQAGTVPTGWRLDNATTLYDVSSHALEERDMNGQYRAVKYNANQSHIFASANFAQYNDFAYSGAEEEPYMVATNEFFSGGVQCVGTWSAERGHTGLYSVKASTGVEGFSFQTISKADTYVITFWASSETAEAKVSINGVAQSFATKKLGQAGTWYLMEAEIPIAVAGQSLRLACVAKSADTYFDDFRAYPKGSEVLSFVYNKWGELSHILDRNNVYTKYEYDDMGKLTDVYHERLSYGVVKTGHTVYHYANH